MCVTTSMEKKRRRRRRRRSQTGERKCTKVYRTVSFVVDVPRGIGTIDFVLPILLEAKRTHMKDAFASMLKNPHPIFFSRLMTVDVPLHK